MMPMALMKLPDRLVIALSHGEDDVDNSPDDKDEDEAGCVGKSSEAPRPIYDRPPPGGVAISW